MSHSAGNHGLIRTRIIVIAAVIGGLALAACNSSPTKVSSSSESNGGNGNGGSSSQHAYKVGDEVKVGDWTVQVFSVTDPLTPTNQFVTPSAGSKFIGLDTQVKNTTSESHTFSSLLGFSLSDSTNRRYSPSFAGVTPAAPDGTVEPGGAIRGTVVFEVPEAATGLKLHFSPGLTSGSAVIELG